MEASTVVRSIEQAEEAMLDLAGGISLWYHIWGNPNGIPVIFIHGGPGNCVGDYDGINAFFFEADQFRVVEVDQRGTGRSQPSVRSHHENMQQYLGISIEMMSADFEALRECLGIERWLVFGGSWGSTLGLDYAERYPQRCLGLILRGIYLNTPAEFEAIYTRKPFLDNERRLAEFDTFFEVAAREAVRRGEPELDPDDAERFIRLYEDLIVAGDREAIWRFYVFESNLIEEDPTKLLDPIEIHEASFAEAMSVSFFETRLFIRGTYEEPIDLLERVPCLLPSDGSALPFKTWVVQGMGDEVCPGIFAQQLVEALAAAGVAHRAYFLEAGHVCHSESMKETLKKCVNEFLDETVM